MSRNTHLSYNPLLLRAPLGAQRGEVEYVQIKIRLILPNIRVAELCHVESLV